MIVTPEAPASETAAKSAGHAAALAALAKSSSRSSPAPHGSNAASGAATAAAAAPAVPAQPQLEPEEVRFWMRQSVILISLAATVVSMYCAHLVGKSFIGMVSTGATAAILTGIAGTVVAHICMPQVLAPNHPVEAGAAAAVQAGQAVPAADGSAAQQSLKS
jgi:cell wall-associated NlpC family hydrolase